MAAQARSVIIHGKRYPELHHSPRHGRSECDLWGVTRANVRDWNGLLDDWTAWFDPHDPQPNGAYRGSKALRPKQWAWFKTLDGSRPVYLHSGPDPDVPGSVRFPVEDVTAAYPDGYWGCATALCIGFAMLQGYRRIILNGVGVSTDPMHRLYHESILAMIYYARGKGVIVDIEGPSVYRNDGGIYGYTTFGPHEKGQG